MRTVFAPSFAARSVQSFTFCTSLLVLRLVVRRQKLLPTGTPEIASFFFAAWALSFSEVRVGRLGQVVRREFDRVERQLGREVDELEQRHRRLLEVEELAEAVRGEAELQVGLVGRALDRIDGRGEPGAQAGGDGTGRRGTGGEREHVEDLRRVTKLAPTVYTSRTEGVSSDSPDPPGGGSHVSRSRRLRSPDS